MEKTEGEAKPAMTEAMREQFEAWYATANLSGCHEKIAAWYGYAKAYQAALRSPAVAGLVEALRKSNEALDAIAGEMTVGDRFTNAGQFLLDAIPMGTAALAQYATLAGEKA